MKKLIFLGLAIVLATACKKQEQRYTQQSPEIETVKTAIKNYNNKTYDTSIYADTAKISYNSSKRLTPSEAIAYHQANDTIYASRSFMDKDQEYEMVVTDEGKTWVNFWSDWKGTLAANGKEISIPVHLTFQFIDGKIVRESGYWDPTEVIMALQDIEAAEHKSMTAEKTP